MNRISRPLFVVLLALVLTSLALTPLAPGCSGPRPAEPPTLAFLGQPAPELSLAWLDGSPPGDLAALRGRVVLLEFWRTW